MHGVERGQAMQAGSSLPLFDVMAPSQTIENSKPDCSRRTVSQAMSMSVACAKQWKAVENSMGGGNVL